MCVCVPWQWRRAHDNKIKWRVMIPACHVTFQYLSFVHHNLLLANYQFEYKINYYSFKIFLRFWLAKIPRIILAIFDQIWKNFAICELMTSMVQQNCQVIEPLTEKTWEEVELFWSWVQKWRNISLVLWGRNGRTNCYKHSKNSKKTNRRTTVHLLFGEYLRSWTTFYLLLAD